MSANTRPRHLVPSVPGELSSEEGPLATPFLALGVQVIHELVDESDGYLLDLALWVRHLAHEDVAGGVYAAFGVGVQHGNPLCGELVQRDVVLDVLRDEIAVLPGHGAGSRHSRMTGWWPVW